MDAFLTVLLKVAVMLILMGVGWLITKKGVLSDRGVSEITWLLLNIVTPCLIISSFMSVESGAISGNDLLLSVATAALSIGIGIAVSLVMYRKLPKEKRNVLRFSIVFSNAGFMGMPLIQGVLGDSGVIYGSFFIAVFNLICWTYGYYMMSGGAKIPLKRILLNPGMIGLAVGLPIYLLGLNPPELVQAPVQAFSDLNTPLAMLVVGSNIAKVSASSFWTDRHIYSVALLRLALVPLLLMGVLLLIRPNENLFVSTVIQTCTPTAANCVLFAVMFGADARLAAKTVAATTFLSVITIPFIIVIAQMLAKLVV